MAQVSQNRSAWQIGIIAGVVATMIYGLLFQKFTEFLAGIATDAIGSVFRSYIDQLYEQATLNPVGAVAATSFGMIPVIPIAVLAISRMLLNRPATPEGFPKWFDLDLLLLPIGFFIFVTWVSAPLIAVGAQASFERRMMALTPVMKEEEQKDIRRQWALIRSKADYDKINKALESIARKNNQELPARVI